MGIHVSVDAKMMTFVYLAKAWAQVSKMSRMVQKSKEIDVKSRYSLQGNCLANHIFKLFDN